MSAAEVQSTARAVVAIEDVIDATADVGERVQLLDQYLEAQRQFAIAVAVEAAGHLDESARRAVLRIMAAAEMYRVCKGAPPTLAHIAALIMGTDTSADLPFEAADRLFKEVAEIGNLPEARTWLN